MQQMLPQIRSPLLLAKQLHRRGQLRLFHIDNNSPVTLPNKQLYFANNSKASHPDTSPDSGDIHYVSSFHSGYPLAGLPYLPLQQRNHNFRIRVLQQVSERTESSFERGKALQRRI